MYRFFLNIYFLLLCLIPLFSIGQARLDNKWHGKVKEGVTIYDFTIIINSQDNDSIFGTAISKFEKFYCETKFRGRIENNLFTVQETEVIKLFPSGIENPCMMEMKLFRNKEKLSGNFTSKNNKKGVQCGSGTISLSLVKEKTPSKALNEVSRTAIAEQPIIKKEVEVVRQTERKNIEQSISAPTKLNNQRKIEKREIQLLNAFHFTEDSVMLKIYDNGVIDGDIISLIINGTIVFDKVKLTASPLIYELKSNNTNQFQIEFYADNLGEIPPNTGLITISSASKTSEVLFSSDLKKSAAIKVVLKNLP
jgi:hypothetical protein